VRIASARLMNRHQRPRRVLGQTSARIKADRGAGLREMATWTEKSTRRSRPGGRSPRSMTGGGREQRATGLGPRWRRKASPFARHHASHAASEPEQTDQEDPLTAGRSRRCSASSSSLRTRALYAGSPTPIGSEICRGRGAEAVRWVTPVAIQHTPPAGPGYDRQGHHRCM